MLLEDMAQLPNSKLGRPDQGLPRINSDPSCFGSDEAAVFMAAGAEGSALMAFLKVGAIIGHY
jgi:hypothetical protein